MLPVLSAQGRFAGLVGGWLVKGYNGVIRMDEAIKAQWAQVENQLQRRNDLIPNLVSTVKGYAAHEQGVFEAVAESRAKLAGAKTPDEAMKAANDQTAALSRLLLRRHVGIEPFVLEKSLGFGHLKLHPVLVRSAEDLHLRVGSARRPAVRQCERDSKQRNRGNPDEDYGETRPRDRGPQPFDFAAESVNE